jgi:hypothetical protein
MPTLREFYNQLNDGGTSFTNAFLSGPNLLDIQVELTALVNKQSGQPGAPLVTFSDALIGGLLYFSSKFRNSHIDKQVLSNANTMFINMYAPGMVWEENQGNFWKRWCADGIPDPNTIPLPMQPDKRDMQLETSGYHLSYPWGTENYPKW